jgi:hypothetical protein
VFVTDYAMERYGTHCYFDRPILNAHKLTRSRKTQVSPIKCVNIRIIKARCKP